MAQPQRVYDDDSNERPVTRPNLHLVGNEKPVNENLSQPLGGATNPSGYRKRKATKAGEPKSLSPEQLQEAESGTGAETPAAATLGTAAESKSLYRPEENKHSPFKGKGKKKSHKKLFLAGGALAGIGLLVGLVALMLFLGSLLIPDFASHITEYQFARVARTFQDDANMVTAEKTAVDASDDTLFSSIQSTYQSVRDNTWGVFDQYRPNKVIQNLQTEGTLSFDYSSGVLSRQTLQGVTFNNVTYPIDNGGFFGALHPIQNFKNDVQLSQDFGTALDASLRDETGIIVRGAVESQIRQQLGISLLAWVVGKYQGKTQAQADAQMEQDAFEKINDPSAVDSAGVSQLDNTAQDVVNAEQACAEDASCLAEEVANGGAEPAAVLAAVESGTSSGFLGSAVVSTLAGPIVSVGIPVCMIYSGSLQNSGPTIDANNAENQRTYFLVASAADQQKNGNTNAEAVGAMNWKLGDTTQSNAYIRESGGTVNTSQQLSPQASNTGQFTIFNAILGGTLGTALDFVANNACPTITSPGFIGASILAGPVIAFFSGGGWEALSGGVSGIVGNFVTQFTTTDGLQEFLGSTLKVGGAIIGGTLLAKAIVANSSGAVNNGFSTGTAFDNSADEGGNLNANQDMQQQFYGIPMNNVQTAQAKVADQQYLADQTKLQSTYQRYFAFSNPDSLVSRFGLSIAANVNSSIFSSFITGIGKIFNPLTLLPKMFGSLNNKALAASTNDTQDYGIVQWGWTLDEQNLMSSDPSYQPLENAKTFTDEWNNYHAKTGGDLEADIQNKYGKCFTDTMGVLLSGSDNGNVPEITRDQNGNVTGGLCSSQNLSYGNNEFEPQAVFRWRLMKYYNAGLDQLEQVQNAGSGS